MAIASVNPATGKTLEKFDSLGKEEIEKRIGRAAAAFARHRRTTFVDRARCMKAAAALLESEADTLAGIITMEMGKPLRAAREEIAKCANACHFYAKNAEEL
ncbi:MAG: aldehyde dehydrogenase family protein, partial [Chthoniobacterales bacterium]